MDGSVFPSIVPLDSSAILIINPITSPEPGLKPLTSIKDISCVEKCGEMK